MLNNLFNVELIDTIPKYLSTINVLTNYSEFAIDTETYVLPQYKNQYRALDVHNSSISTFQILPKDTNTVYVFDFITLEKLKFNKQLFFEEVLRKAKILLAHNSSFEAKFIKKYFGELLHNFWCTRVASQLINNAFGSKFSKSASGNSLEDLCRDYLSVKLIGKDTVRVEDWYPRPLSRAQVEYAATDTIYLFQLKDILESTICTPFPDPENYDPDLPWGLGMGEILDLEMQFISVEAECEYNGLPANSVLTNSFENTLWDDKTESGYLLKLGGELADNLGLVTYIPMGLDADYKVPPRNVMRKFNSPEKLKEIINTHIGPTDSAEGKVVTRIVELIESLHSNNSGEASDSFYSKDEEEAYKELIYLTDEEIHSRSNKAKLLIKYKQYFKQAGMKLSKYINNTTGRVHYNFNSLGTATGRSSSSRPNSQNINAKVHLLLPLTIDFNLDNIFTADCLPASKL